MAATVEGDEQFNAVLQQYRCAGRAAGDRAARGGGKSPFGPIPAEPGVGVLGCRATDRRGPDARTRAHRCPPSHLDRQEGSGWRAPTAYSLIELILLGRKASVKHPSVDWPAISCRRVLSAPSGPLPGPGFRRCAFRLDECLPPDGSASRREEDPRRPGRCADPGRGSPR